MMRETGRRKTNMAATRPSRLARPILLLGLVAATGTGLARSREPAPTFANPSGPPAFLDTYCSDCHNDIDREAGFSIEDLKGTDPLHGANAELWEKILRRVNQNEMPPRKRDQPSGSDRAGFTQWLRGSLDGFAFAHPDPGRAGLRRLNRVEYANAVRDLLALDTDLSHALPQDNSGYGFDNIADVLSVSPTLMDRYVAVAGQVSRLAVGIAPARPRVTAHIVPKDGSIMNSGRPAYNERASDLLPLASRGGDAFAYYAPASATYEISGWLNANTNNETDRLSEDRVSLRLPLSAGRHIIGMAFRRQLAPEESVQTLRNNLDMVPLPKAPPALLPLDVLVDGARVKTLVVPSYRLSPRYSQANFPRDLQEIDVAGPYEAAARPAQTPSRRRIFTCYPATPAQDAPCARQILLSLARPAWRRPVGPADIAPLMRLYAAARATGSFDTAIAAAIEGLLVSPHFLFVAESDPAGAAPGTVHALSDQDLATRLSLFLWSSIPDERLLALAQSHRLHQPAVLDGEVTRMLADPRAQALTANFAGQWLYLRNLDQQKPDTDVFPQFDTRLRSAMAAETNLFFTHVLRANRPILDFLSSDYTFLNARLAQHYGIPGVSGTAMRRVALDPAWHRGGLLGQASILTVTSYGNHTSVVRRGKWILETLLAAAPPPPPPDVPALETAHDGRLLTARQQLELHRSKPACAGCHSRMDPLGFALENYDAVGAWRSRDVGQPIDVAAVMPDGTGFAGIAGLQGVLLARRDEFAAAFTERLMTYALGRGVGPFDRPAIRAIAARAAADNYRIQTIIRAIVQSEPFRLRKVPGDGPRDAPPIPTPATTLSALPASRPAS
ncbi:MAG TPA: DUF1592 domain-containing protein [Novosphingobium sp.]|nr:DUF1592 domain-containing protein [Novosphingobium sp.]